MQSRRMGVRAARWCVALLWLGALLSSARAEAADQACIDEPARQALSCEGIQKRRVVARRPFSGRAPKADPPAAPPAVPSADTLADLTRKTRGPHRDLRERELELLIREIANVERLLDVTTGRDKDHPRILRRLADDYVELASLLFREQIHKEDFSREIRELNPVRARRFRDQAKALAKRVKRARRAAIEHYAALVSEHPSYCHLPGLKDPQQRSCTDEVLYYLAYEHEQLGQSDEARKRYFELVQDHPKSRYLPKAYLAFGELFFSEAQTDPSRWPSARKFYEKVLTFPPPANELWAYAHYKLGYVDWNEGKHAEALDHFREVIEVLGKHPGLPNAAGLADAARRDIVPVYAQTGKATKAWDFLAPLSGDKRGQTARTLEMVERLGQTLMDTGQHAEAIALHHELVRRGPDARSCRYRAEIAKATRAAHPADERRIVKVLLELADDHDDPSSDASEQKLCANTTAALLTETAMGWHIEAVGSGGVRGTERPDTMAAADELYRRVSDTFSVSDFASFTFPHLVKEDWPTLAGVRYARADLAFHRKRWVECGEAFMAAFEADPDAPEATEALFASAQCWQQVVVAQRRDDEHRRRLAEPTLEPQPIEGSNEKMLATLDRYACAIAPPSKGDALDDYVDVLFARARAYYELGHFSKAALAFRAIAIDHAESDAAPFAANLYLDSLEVMRKRWHRPGCVQPMKQDVPRMLRDLCAGGRNNAQTCATLQRVSRDLVRIEAESEVALGQQGGGGAKTHFARGCELYLSLWTNHGKRACRDEDASCSGYPEVLHNAAAACQAGHLLAKAISIRKVLLDADYHLHESELAVVAARDIGANYQAIANYDEAATWYERFAELSQEDGAAATALSDAVTLRLGLGQHEQAIRDAKRFESRYGHSQPRQAAQIAFAVGAHHVAHGRWRNAEQTLSRALRRIETSGSPELRVRSWALLGRAHEALEHDHAASRFYGKAKRVDIAELKRALAVDGGTERERRRKLARALDAVGESLFHFAERERRAVEAIAYPTYRGAGTVADIERFIDGPVAKWFVDKKAAIVKATKAYHEVVALDAPSPPPRWAVASGAAVGGMWGALVEDVLDAPYPKAWDQDGFVAGSQPPVLWHELRSAYQAGLLDAVKPYKQTAKAAFTHCLEYGILYQYFDGELRRCEQWLGANYPNEFHVVDELVDQPTRLSSPLHQRPPPLDLDGSVKTMELPTSSEPRNPDDEDPSEMDDE